MTTAKSRLFILINCSIPSKLQLGREITFGAFAECILYDLVDELSPDHANGTIMGWGLNAVICSI